MTRHVLALVSIAALLGTPPAEGGVRGQIISERTAAQHGLTRPWFTHVRMDRRVGEIRHMVLHKGTLFVQTDQAVLHALDAETGQTLWYAQIGRRGHPSMAPGVNDDLVGVVNGSVLYVVNRFNGKILWKTQTDGAPGAGATLSQTRAYVPMVDGLVASYRLKTLKDPMAELLMAEEEGLTPEEEQALEAERRETIRLQQEYIPPLLCRTWGRIFVPPVVAVENEGEELIAWATDRGSIFVGRIDRREEASFTIRYRLETGAEIVAAPSLRPPDPADKADRGTLYAASRDGFVHAIRAHDGEPVWRFSAGEPLVQPPVYVDGRIFAAIQLGGMHCLDAHTGAELWWAPHIMQFVAVSNSRVYTVDNLNRLVVLDLQTGARLDTLSVLGLDLRLINTQTDRIYLADRKGLVQCLHEVGLEEPIQHLPEPPPPEEGAGEEGPAPGAAAPPESPFGAPQQNPFGGGAGGQQNPFDGAGDGGAANPFGAESPF